MLHVLNVLNLTYSKNSIVDVLIHLLSLVRRGFSLVLLSNVRDLHEIKVVWHTL